MSPEEFSVQMDGLRASIARVYCGQKGVVEALLTGLLAGGNLLLEGVPGLGKTLLVRTLADVFQLSFRRIQFTPDLMPADIIGTTVMVSDDRGERRLQFREGPVFAQVVLADEINRATPKTQSALLEAMQEQTVTTGGETRPLPAPFFVLATQNPLEMEGTYPLPEAQLDRFLMKISVPFPSLDELAEVMDRTTAGIQTAAQCVMGAEQLQAMQARVREVVLPEPVKRYALRLLLATHPKQSGAPNATARYVRHGASPRGAQALILTARARALSQGRMSVSFDDIRSYAHDCLRHRIQTNFEAQAEGVTAEQIINEILKEVSELPPHLAGEVP